MTIYDYLGGNDMPRIKEAIGAVFATATMGAFRIGRASNGTVFMENLAVDKDVWTLFYVDKSGGLMKNSVSAPWHTALEDGVLPHSTIRRLFE